MNRFAELLDRLAYEPGRNNKLRLMTDYFRSTPDPERGWALAALTGALSFPHAKAGLIRSLIAERTDPVLFELSYDYVGDLSETVALMWPASSPSPQAGRGRASGGEPNNPHHRHRNTVDARQGAIAATARALARCARRDRALGADQARHRRIAHRRVGAARQSRRRRARRQGGAGDRAAFGPAWRRPIANCSPGSRARAKSRRAPIRRRSGRRCWRMRSTTPISPRSTPPISWRNGNGTASACRPSRRDRTAKRSRGFIRAPARIFPKAFPICSTLCVCPAPSTASF